MSCWDYSTIPADSARAKLAPLFLQAYRADKEKAAVYLTARNPDALNAILRPARGEQPPIGAAQHISGRDALHRTGEYFPLLTAERLAVTDTKTRGSQADTAL